MRNKESTTKISIIIPAYKEEQYIEGTLKDVRKVLQSISQNFEIICVVDGIIDETFNKAKAVSIKYPKIKVLGYLKNRGKGFAVRIGFDLAKGEIIGFIDADGQINPKVLKEAIKKIEIGEGDIVVGSKKHPKTQIKYPLFRKIVSTVSQFFIKTLFNIKVSDTQAGVKVFRRKVVNKLNPRLTVDRFGFDIEMLAVSRYLGFTNIEEIPIEVKVLEDDKGSINFVYFIRDVFKTFFESIWIFYRLKLVNYYNDSNKANWITFVKPKLITS